MTRELTPRGRERRRQLLDVATSLFGEHGYHQTSVADIVDAAGVGKGVFYWYFASKEELFLELLNQAHHDLRRAHDIAVATEPDPLRRIERGIRAALSWLEDNRTVLALFQLAATDERFVGALHAGEGLWADEIAAHLKEGIVTGHIPDGDPQVLAHAVLGAVRSLANTFLGRQGAWDEGVADTAVAFCVGGLLATRRGSSGPA